MNNLQKALFEIQEEKTTEYDEQLSKQPPNHFSAGYRRRRKEIIKVVSRRDSKNQTINAYEYRRRAHRLNIRTILVAAIIMIMATASVIAIVKPQIYYDIKEMIDRWKITFSVEGAEGETEFTPVKPQIPEGFRVVSEESSEFSYILQMQDEEGHDIVFDQSAPEGLSVIIDSEKHDTTTKMYNNREIVISKSDNATTLLYNDGQYVYLVDGDVDEEILMQVIKSLPTE